jgi:hypothetical protein
MLQGVKWTAEQDFNRFVPTLRRKAENFPLAEGRRLVPAPWLKAPATQCPADVTVFTPTEVMKG